MKTIKYYSQHPRSFFTDILRKYFQWLPDALFLRILFLIQMRKWLNLRNPKTFNEKLQWLKLYNRRPEYTNMVDKYEVKDFVAKTIGKKFVIPSIGIWDKPEDIDWDSLPDKFVLKTTHGGGSSGVILCKSKSKLKIDEVIMRLHKSLKQDIYRSSREWPYKNVSKRILAEQYIETNDGDLKDYKFFCFDGEVKFFKVDFDRQIKHRANYYDRMGKIQEFGEPLFPPDFEKIIEMPNNLDEMIGVAEKLSRGLPFVRVDLYNNNGNILFGELTFYPTSGLEGFIPREYDYKIGALLNI